MVEGAVIDGYRSLWDLSQVPQLDNKVVIVTGANSGIGYETALELARKHAHVVLACRSKERGEQAERDIKSALSHDPNAKVEFMRMDLSDLASVCAFAEAFQAKFDRVDILVNNAGLMVPTQTHTEDGLEMQFAVNHLGHFYLTYLLFKSLKKGGEYQPSRIVNISSVVHRLARLDFSTIARSSRGKWMYMNEYAVSKLSNLLFTYELNRQINAAGLTDKIIAVAAHPGITFSDLVPKMIIEYLPRFLHGTCLNMISRIPIFQSAQMGALPSIFAAVDSSVQAGDFYGPNGLYNFWGNAPIKEISSVPSYSEEYASLLWKLSEDITECTFSVA